MLSAMPFTLGLGLALAIASAGAIAGGPIAVAAAHTYVGSCGEASLGGSANPNSLAPTTTGSSALTTSQRAFAVAISVLVAPVSYAKSNLSALDPSPPPGAPQVFQQFVNAPSGDEELVSLQNCASQVADNFCDPALFEIVKDALDYAGPKGRIEGPFAAEELIAFTTVGVVATAATGKLRVGVESGLAAATLFGLMHMFINVKTFERDCKKEQEDLVELARVLRPPNPAKSVGELNFDYFTGIVKANVAAGVIDADAQSRLLQGAARRIQWVDGLLRK